jgi:hypothetical protein
MKWNNILHALAAVACITGIFTTANAWAGIALLWIVTSFINASRAHILTKQIEQMDTDRNELISHNIKLEGQVWDAEMKLVKANKK